MTDEEYKQSVADIKARLGEPKYDMGDPVNESARQLSALKAKKARDAKLELNKAIAEAKPVKQRYSAIRSINLVDNDLRGFSDFEKDVIRAWFEDRTQSFKTLANRFGCSYQQVSGVLRDKRVQFLDVKYFNETLEDNTKLALLRLTQDADPKVTLAAAEYLTILQHKETENEGIKTINDPVVEEILAKVGDWIAGGMSVDLILKGKQ